MRSTKRLFALGLALAASAATAAALPIVDGTRDGEYGGDVAVQTVQTQFGDNFNEWNAAYARIDGGRLYLMLTGNLEANFNRLEIFIDSRAGGQSVFDSAGNDSAGNMDGLVFDLGFQADFHLIARRGFNGTANVFDLDFADLNAQAASGYFNLFGGSSSGSGSTGTGVNPSPIFVGYNGSNTAGVTGGTGAADQNAARAVTTGFEFSISLVDLGYTSGPLNIMIGQNNTDHNFWSNQLLGGLQPPQGNLGGDGAGGFTGEGAIDFNAFAGNQFFTVPEPSTWALLGGGLVLVVALRKRRSCG